jgi:hypothetical protein
MIELAIGYLIWFALGMIAGESIWWIAVRRDPVLRWRVSHSDIWSRVPFGGPLVLLLLADLRDIKRRAAYAPDTRTR